MNYTTRRITKITTIDDLVSFNLSTFLKTLGLQSLKDLTPERIQTYQVIKDHAAWATQHALPQLKTSGSSLFKTTLLLANTECGMYLDRKSLDLLKTAEPSMFMSCDTIQTVNKCDQTHFKMCKARGKYAVIIPFEYPPKRRIRRNLPLQVTKDLTDERKRQLVDDEKDNIRQLIKHLKSDYLDIPFEQWQVGHMNPDGKQEDYNFVIQPPIQAAYRDNYIFTDCFSRLPTPQTMTSRADKDPLWKSILKSYRDFFQHKED